MTLEWKPKQMECMDIRHIPFKFVIRKPLKRHTKFVWTLGFDYWWMYLVVIPIFIMIISFSEVLHMTPTQKRSNITFQIKNSHVVSSDNICQQNNKSIKIE